MTFAIPPGVVARTDVEDLRHGWPTSSSDEDLTAQKAMKTHIKKGRYQGQHGIQSIMVVVPAIVEGVALLAAIVPFGSAPVEHAQMDG